MTDPEAPPAAATRRDWRVGLGERFGRVPATPPGHRAVWVHGASVGEVTALAPLVAALREELPRHRLVVSAVTPAGRAVSALRVPEADARIFLPLDLPCTVRRALDAVRPSLVLFSETELWPSFLSQVARRGIPSIMVSGRISERGFRGYRRWRWLFAPALRSVRWFCVQSVASAERLVALGAAPDRIVVTGSLKGSTIARAGALSLARLGAAAAPVLVAGSTHDGEEAALVAVWRQVRADEPRLRLVLAPRRPERFDDVAAWLAAEAVPFVRRSALRLEAAAPWPAAAPVLLLDTLGELGGLYAGARAAFVGGTLVPVGGHNVREPAAAGVPVLFGPHVAQVAAITARLRASDAGWQIGDTAALAARVRALVRDPAAARAAGARAQRAAAGEEGALAVTLAVVRGTLAAADRAAPWPV